MDPDFAATGLSLPPNNLLKNPKRRFLVEDASGTIADLRALCHVS
jgi:hypothetical protein